MDDLWYLRDGQKATLVADRLESAWRASDGSGSRSARGLLRICLRLYAWTICKGLVWFAFYFAAAMMTNAVLIVELLNVLERFAAGKEPVVQAGELSIPYAGFIYATLFLIGEMIRSLCINQFWAYCSEIGTRLRGGLTAMVFRKLTRVQGLAETGEVLNLVQNDAERILQACLYSSFVVTTPIMLLVIVLLGQAIIGPAMYIGLLVLLVSLLVQVWIGSKTAQIRVKAIRITDERLNLMGEVLKAAQLIKLYAWEDSFTDKVRRVRHREIAAIKMTAYVKAINIAYAGVLPVFTSLCTFAFHVFVMDQELTAQQAYAVVGLFNVARFPLSVIPNAVRNAAEALVSFKRFHNFLSQEEIIPEELLEPLPFSPSLPVIEIHNARFTRAPRERTVAEPPTSQGFTQNTGTNVSVASTEEIFIEDFVCPVGSLTAIIGQVGSGKTSLLNGCILGMMRKVSGEGKVRGKVAYVSQRPWVFSGTVKENICMSSAFDAAKFNEIVRVCQLEQDLQAFSAGSDTELGERGINISGGQKARVALARALYSDADLYILDDVLSAVDAHVKQKLWEGCLRGYLKGKTIVLATHALELLPQADNIVIMSHMAFIAQGSFAALSTSSFASYVTTLATVSVSEEKQAAGAKKEADNDYAEDGPAQDGKLLTKEDREVGAVSRETLAVYARASGGICVCIVVAVLFLLADGAKTASDFWLVEWTQGDESPVFYVSIYAALVVGMAVLQLTRGIMFAKTALKAAQELHGAAWEAVIHAEMAFFHQTPLGRIIARFGADMDKVDVFLVDIADWAFSLAARCTLSLVVIIVIIPAFLIIFFPLLFFYYRMFSYVRKVVRQMKRIDNISKTPLVSLVQSTSQGLTTVRAYGAIPLAVRRNEMFTDDTSRAYFSFQYTNRWIGFRLDYITTTIITICAFLVTIFAETINPAIAGLVLTQALSTAGILQFGTRQAAELEAQFTSVERLRHFIENTPKEQQVVTKPNSDGEQGTNASGDANTAKPNHHHQPGQKGDASGVPNEASSTMTLSNAKVKSVGDGETGKSWPTSGAVSFEGFSARYREGLPLVLDEVSFSVKGGDRAALVGRTGSGKSSALLCLFRMMEGTAGRIVIDGKDIASVPLATLRSKALAVVPQDAVLFAGSIRYNLDPFGQHEDKVIWEALEKVCLKEHVQTLVAQEGSKGGDALEYELLESGSNLSSGQRQLFCFARALLKKAPIICVDEGTSSVDEKSDKVIQQTLKSQLKGHTLIIVAHRLNTVRDVDTICVLNAGKVVEVGSPDDLLQTQNSMFRSMWLASNNQTEVELTEA